MLKKSVVVMGLMALLSPVASFAASDAELRQIREEIRQMKEVYEAKIKSLEDRLKNAEEAVTAKTEDIPEKKGDSPNAFNPQISLVLAGGYANLSKDPANYKIGRFFDSGGQGPGPRGFSLQESELGISANIDPDWYGGFNLSMMPNNTVSVEEAFIQSLGLSNGLSLKAGRFFSGIGYLNSQHAHTWDFADNPLAYQAFLGTQLGEDGIQLKWLAPTDISVELGAEIGRGRLFPANSSNKNGIGAGALYAHVGSDIGDSASWRAGVSTLQTSPQNRISNDFNLAGNPVADSFSGKSRTNIVDFVGKWAPNGNFYQSYFKLQGEYFQRSEDGSLVVAANPVAAYGSNQSGWYLQGIYQFLPYWRVGLRTEMLDSGNVNLGANSAFLSNIAYKPSKNSLMFDYNPSEFSRFRLQFAKDKSRFGLTDNQVFLQYIMSLGAHGAHQY